MYARGLLCLFTALLMLQGCGVARIFGFSPATPESPDRDAAPIDWLVWVGTIIGGLAFLLAFVVGYLRGVKAGILCAVFGIGLIVSAQLLAWFDANKALIAIIATVGAVVWGIVRLRGDPVLVRRVEEATGIDLPDGVFPAEGDNVG